MTDLRQRLIACFSTAFPHLSKEEIPQASLRSVSSWDSMVTVTLIAVIEKEFVVQISSADLDEFGSFELILAYLQRQARVSPEPRSIAARSRGAARALPGSGKS
jgi:acyl carrier protein